MSKHFTRQEIEEIRMQLAQQGKKDTDFEETDKFVGDDFFVIVQDGVNKKISGHTFRSDYNEIAEQDHLRAMEDRQTANSDHVRAENDHSRALTDSGRASQDHNMAESDNSRALEDHRVAESDHRRAVEDHSTATNDTSRAQEDHDRAEEDNARAALDHAQAEDDHIGAYNDRQAAASDRGLADSDRMRAESDHNTATEDHLRAEQDHTTADTDHTRAESDHAAAAADHTQAATDHTTAASDHTQADNDHTRAEGDHEQATADHAVMAGYDTRLGNVEDEVTQLDQDINVHILEYTTDIETTRISLPRAKRKFGVTLIYLVPNVGIRVETFNNTVAGALNDTYFKRDIYWTIHILNKMDIFEAFAENIAFPNAGYVYHSPSNPSSNVQIISTDDYSYSAPIPVVKGDVIKVLNHGFSNNVAVITKCDEQGNLIESLVQSTDYLWLDANQDREFYYLAKESGYIIVSVRNLYTETRLAQKGHVNLSFAIADIWNTISDYNAVKESVAAIEETLDFKSPYLETLDKDEANASTYLNPNYELVLNDSGGKRWLSNPIYLHKGDSILVHSTSMSVSIAVVALATTADLTTASFQTLVRGNGESGYQDYNYTIQRSGYYVIGWAASYPDAYAKIQHIAYSNIPEYDEHFSEVDEKLAKIDDTIGVAMNVFGDVLPKNFRDKLFNSEDDVEIVCVGDSLTGMIDYCDAVEEPAHTPPGMTNKHWTYLLWDRICLNKPVCDRLDSQRSGTDVFTKTGTWEWKDFNSSSSSGLYGQYSLAANTFGSTDLNASVAFSLDLDIYEKASIVFMIFNKGCDTEVIVSEGNGKLLASLDKTNWVEANGFSVNQTFTPAAYGFRHRRIWLKRAEGASGIINITYKRKSSDTDTTHTMYCWGTERWNEATVFLTNLGRGGRDISQLGSNINDVFERKADLCILEMPLANETLVASKTLSVLKGDYLAYIDSFKTNSADFTTTELLVVLPHGRSGYYDGNIAIKMAQAGSTIDMINHLKCNAVYNYVKNLIATYDEHANCINLMEQLYNEGLNKNMTIQAWLAPSTVTIPTMTKDGIHLVTYGSRFWAKYLSAIFQ